jgi:hypothetical protein
MITNKGKDVIAKYMIGQAQAYASYISLGCGPEAKTAGTVLGNYSDKHNLDFEMVRVPIISRGYVTETVDGVPVSKVVLTAELPTEQRYKITEVGIYPAKSNPSASGKDSKILYSFSDSENWEFHNETSASSIPAHTGALDTNLDPGTISIQDVFRTTSNNPIFDNSVRVSRNEPCRFLNNIIAIPGDTSYLQASGGVLSVKPSDGTYYGNHIHLASPNLTLGTNSPDDEIKLAFSVINRSVSTTVPTKAMVLVEFASDDIASPANYAKFSAEVSTLGTNRYFVITKKLSELSKSEGFSWNNVNIVRIYATVLYNGAPSNDFLVCLDALRFENVTSENPLYGLTGYTVVRTSDGTPISKEANTSNMIEFRFGLDVGV